MWVIPTWTFPSAYRGLNTYFEKGTHPMTVPFVTKPNMERVEEALLCATTASSLYNSALKYALLDRQGRATQRIAAIAAFEWVALAIRASVIRSRTTDDNLTTADLLALALALHEYYAEHLDEFSVEVRISTAKRLGV